MLLWLKEQLVQSFLVKKIIVILCNNSHFCIASIEIAVRCKNPAGTRVIKMFSITWDTSEV